MTLTSPAPWWLSVLLAGGIAIAAWRARSLRLSGAVGAFVIGTLALRVGAGWGVFLIAWFVLASVLSRIGRQAKEQRTRDIVAKGDQRDAWQVLANGGVFALCAAIALALDSDARWLGVAAAGSLAAAGADTWSTEIGTLWGGTPYSLRERRRVPPGTSGAITLAGSVGGLAGAFILSMLAVACAVIDPVATISVAVGGTAGAWMDTWIGAWVQERRWCPRCERATERDVHSCGTSTEQRGGWRRLDNDAVNAVCSVAGAVVAVVAASLFAPLRS